MAQVCPWGARRVTAEDLCIAAVSWGEVADGRLGAYWIHTSLGTARNGYREYTPLSSRDLFPGPIGAGARRSEEHTSELQSLMRISYAVFCLKKKKARLTTQVKRASIVSRS